MAARIILMNQRAGRIIVGCIYERKYSSKASMMQSRDSMMSSKICANV